MQLLIKFLTMKRNISIRPSADAAQVSIYSLDGKLLIKKLIDKVKTKIDVSPLAKGTYKLRVSSTKSVYTTKFEMN